ncbi:aldo/keto reductase [Rahnella aceris]|jgi:diketogulonate reductase-like aldo/keto reductase|uniref:Aldo/keto reductase n=1 Tax=Rahnella sp. (strain Y9602) TaxID=2703885 RepID=A0A0H3F9Z1_RAHSY|nr:aldo/keto reductase [Rahnella aceris]ADW73659.1 aldo/keto reductase [Rahnella aceris]AFE58310.1 aldo/keto reductase [Rahnella aquatilis HX2]MBU9861522.1 aldo/keto reductase [Rahnella aceris]
MKAKTVQLPDGTTVPAIGQGTWYMGERNSDLRAEVKALQQGLDAGMTLIDTAEMYADGGAERVVGEAISGRRDDVFLVSKVYPHHAGGAKAIAACEQSLKRLKTDCLDLYLLHWRGSIPLHDTVTAMEKLQQSGKIRRWGVSNLDTDDMQALWNIPGGNACMTNQVLYHAAARGIEFDLLPWCEEHSVPVMAYCPLAQAGKLRHDVLTAPVMQEIANARGVSSAQIALAWVTRTGNVIAIPKAVQPQHVKDNAAALTLSLTADEIARIDTVFPAPNHKTPLDMV